MGFIIDIATPLWPDCAIGPDLLRGLKDSRKGAGYYLLLVWDEIWQLQNHIVNVLSASIYGWVDLR